jgi:lipopolysaccharide export system protein LptA
MQSRRTAIAAALILVALCWAAPALTLPAQAADAWGEIREATRNLNVRAKRDYKSEHVRTLQKGDRVKVDFLKDGWYAVFPLDASDRKLSQAIGFSKSKYLKFISKPSAPEPVAETAAEPAAAAKPDTAEVQKPAPAQAPAAQPEQALGADKARPGETSVSAKADSLPVRSDPGQGQKVVAEVEQRPEDLPQRPASSGKPPVRITADKLTYDDKHRTVSFTGNVEAVHEELNLWANELTAFFDKTGKPGEEIDRIVASGGVRMQRGSTEGTSDSVTYMVKENLLLMEGNPVIRDGKNKVTGKIIKFYVKENRSEVVGGGGKRVEAILFAPETLEAP